jgi:site-specific recombinase XerD
MGEIRIDEFLAGRDLSPAAVAHYVYKLALLSKYLGRRRLSLKLLEQYPGWLRGRGLADASIQTTVAAARAYIRWAVERKYVARECARWRPRIRVADVMPKAISDEDAERLIASATSARDRVLLLLLRDTGARIGTLLAIDVEDIDMSRKRVVVRQKGGGLVMLYLSDRLVEALRVYLGDRRCGPLFFGRAGRLTVPGARHLIQRLARRVGIVGRVNPHSWRHAFARRCVRSGLDLSRTARLLGHKSVAVTARYYAVWDGDELAEAYSRVIGM